MTAPVLDPAGSPEEDRPRRTPVPLPDDESARLAALRSFGVLDQPRQADLDTAARLAAYICDTPAALVNLIDSDRVVRAGVHGAEPGEVIRADSMCQHAVHGKEVIYTGDASTEALFADNPYVTGEIAQVRLYAAAPLLTHDGHTVGTVCVLDEKAGRLDAIQLNLLRDVADQVMALFEMRRLAAALTRAATRDPLTGLGNRRAVETAISGAIARAERGLGTPSVVVVNLDSFKNVNDGLGHGVGDAVLRSVGRRLTATARTVDTVARLGGDEFVVLLEHTGGPGATAAVNRLRRGLEGDWVELGGLDLHASVGITTYRPGDSVATLLARADAEMYADKTRRSGHV